MNKKTKIILFVAIFLFLAGIILYPRIKTYFQTEDSITPTQKSETPSQNNQRRPLNVNALVLKYETLDDVIRGIGRLLPDEEVDLSFETSGKITKIYFKEGTYVRKGDLLAKVNDAPLQAELKKLEAQIPLAQDRVFRQKSLLAKDAVSQEAYESVNTELAKLEADIQLVKARIDQTELRAPFDGNIGLRQVSEGTYASPSTVLARLTKTSPLKIQFSIPEKQANILKVGTPFKFRLDDGASNQYTASVYAIEPNLDGETLTMEVRALYPNQGGILPPGRSVQIEIKVQEIQNTIVVPSLSVIAEMGRDVAYVYKDGRAQQVTLRKGMRTASAIQVLEGLNVGDTLLVTGVMQLRDGLLVAINEFVENVKED